MAYRAIVALGNLVGVYNRCAIEADEQISSPSVNGSLQISQLQQARELAGALAQKLKEQRLKDIAKEVESLSA